jgi:hypothetical protein
MQARCYILPAILPISCPLLPQVAYGVVSACADVMPKHVLMGKANVNEEINSCIIDGKLYVTKVEYSNATGCLNTKFYISVSYVYAN